MLNFDFYDIYAVFVLLRADPQYEHNITIVKALKCLIEAPQNDNTIGDNVVRDSLAKLNNIDREHYNWVFTKNIYTYGHKIIKEEIAYQILLIGFSELLKCLDEKNFDQFKDLADALHNVPIILTENPKYFKKLIKIEISCYRKTWNKDFLKGVIG